MDSIEKYQTFFPQEIGSKEGAVSPFITNSASYGYGDSKTAEAIFSGEAKKPLYARVGNPTTSKLESVLAKMDGGIGAIATSSGMGAITLSCISLLKAGDEVISIGGLFGGTYSFFSETLSRFGIKTSFFGVDEIDKIKNSINQNTKIIFLESVGNPNMELPDFKQISQIADENKIALIVDNTITPITLKPLELGADIVVYSTTKIISGNASALGGAVVFRAVNEQNDKFNTTKYDFLEKFIKKMGKMALIANGKKRALRDFGMSASAFNSQLTMLGLETLPIRTEHIANSVEKIVTTLEKEGLNVNHPSLKRHKHNDRYLKYFKYGCGTLFTIDMGTKEKAFEYIDKLKLATVTANIGDSRTLALHMDSTIYSDFTQEEKEFLGITPGLIRVSIGLENPDDLIKDFLGAAK